MSETNDEEWKKKEKKTQYRGHHLKKRQNLKKGEVTGYAHPRGAYEKKGTRKATERSHITKETAHCGKRRQNTLKWVKNIAVNHRNRVTKGEGKKPRAGNRLKRPLMQLLLWGPENPCYNQGSTGI